MPFIEEPEIIDPLSPIGLPEYYTVQRDTTLEASMSQANAASIIAQTTDPIRLVIVMMIITLLLSRKVNKWVVFACSIIGSAVASEALLYSMQSTRTFGQGMPAGLIASLILTYVGFWLVQKFILKKSK